MDVDFPDEEGGIYINLWGSRFYWFRVYITLLYVDASGNDVPFYGYGTSENSYYRLYTANRLDMGYSNWQWCGASYIPLANFGIDHEKIKIKLSSQASTTEGLGKEGTLFLNRLDDGDVGHHAETNITLAFKDASGVYHFKDIYGTNENGEPQKLWEKGFTYTSNEFINPAYGAPEVIQPYTIGFKLKNSKVVYNKNTNQSIGLYTDLLNKDKLVVLDFGDHGVLHAEMIIQKY